VFFLLAGFLASALLSRRALTLMPADTKAALVDASSSTRLLGLVGMGVFLGLVLWRPLVGWAFLGCTYLGLGVRSVFRLKGLDLPSGAARIVLIGNVCAVAGVVLCSFIFVLRALQ
jgi:hypothetical protein